MEIFNYLSSALVYFSTKAIDRADYNGLIAALRCKRYRQLLLIMRCLPSESTFRT
jgi:hypothetical protein